MDIYKDEELAAISEVKAYRDWNLCAQWADYQERMNRGEWMDMKEGVWMHDMSAYWTLAKVLKAYFKPGYDPEKAWIRFTRTLRRLGKPIPGLDAVDEELAMTHFMTAWEKVKVPGLSGPVPEAARLAEKYPFEFEYPHRIKRPKYERFIRTVAFVGLIVEKRGLVVIPQKKWALWLLGSKKHQPTISHWVANAQKDGLLRKTGKHHPQGRAAMYEVAEDVMRLAEESRGC